VLFSVCKNSVVSRTHLGTPAHAHSAFLQKHLTFWSCFVNEELLICLFKMNSLPPPTCPPRGFSRPLRIRILRFLLLRWTPHAIAAECHVSLRTVQRFARNLLQYGGIRAPAIRKLGRPQRLTTANEEAILEMLLSEG